MRSYIGSAQYMDKRVNCSEPYDISVDIYSLGLVFFYIFKERGIFDNCNPVQVEKLRSQINSNYDEVMEK